MLKKIMYKVKDNTYRLQDFTKKDKIDESKFVEGKTQRGDKRLESLVYVMFEDEYNSFKTKLDNHESEVESLNAIINEKESQINELEGKLDEKGQVNSDEVLQLKDNISIMKEDHQKEIDKLHQEISNMKETHANEILELTNKHHLEVSQLNEEISTLKQEHLEKINEKEQSHNDEREKIRNYFLKVVTLENKEDVSELIELEKSVPSLLKPFMRKHVKQVEDMKERKLLKAPEMTINTYIESGEKEEQ